MARALACACLAVCLVCGSDPDTRALHEQQLLLRMLTLQERAIAADTPLPLTAASLLNVSGGDGSCASGEGGIATSLAAIHFARTATRPALPQSSEAVAFDAAFVGVARTFEAARWQGAQAELYAVCVRAHSVSHSFSQRAHAQHAESAALLSGWARSCASLSQVICFSAHPPISPICRTPRFPYLTVYSVFLFARALHSRSTFRARSRLAKTTSVC